MIRKKIAMIMSGVLALQAWSCPLLAAETEALAETGAEGAAAAETAPLNESRTETCILPMLVGEAAEIWLEAAGTVGDGAQTAGDIAAELIGDASAALQGTAQEASVSAAELVEDASALISATSGEASMAVAEMAEDAVNYLASTSEETSATASKLFRDAIAYLSSKSDETSAAASDLAGDTLNYILSKSGEASEAASNLAEGASDFISSKSDELTAAASELIGAASSQISEASGAAIDAASDSIADAVDFVNESGAVISDSAMEAAEFLRNYGDTLVQAAQDAISSFDLSDEEDVKLARLVIEGTVTSFCRNLGLNSIRDKATIDLLVSFVSELVIGAGQYAGGMITLSEYLSNLISLIINEGLPVGLTFLASLIPIPGAPLLAQAAAGLLLSALPENETGTETGTEAVMGTEAETEA